MYSPEELERDRQEAREKWVRDVEAARHDAWMEGLQQGRDEARKQGFEEGVLIGKIQAAQSFLNEPAGPTEELFQIGVSATRALADKLVERCHALQTHGKAEPDSSVDAPRSIGST